MRILTFLSIVALSCCINDSQNMESFDFHAIERRQATTTKKPATTTTKSITTTKKPTTTTKKPDWTISAPDIKTHLTTASQVFTTLGDIKSAQALAEKYFEIKPVRLVSALKGVSIAASIFASFIDIPDPETEKILNNMNTKFDTMFKKMDSQTSELKSYIDQKFLNTFILAPIKTAEEGMNTYKKKPNDATKAAFLEKTKMAKLPEVVNHILLNTRDFLTNAMINSRYNRSTVQTMSGILIHSFHKACVIEDYRNGIEFKDKLLVERMNTYNDYFLSTVNAYKKISNEVFQELESSFFPGFIEDDIIKPVIDQNEGDHCKKAEDILKKLKVNYSWRQYVVIVAEEKTGFMSSAQFGVPKRSINIESYKGKSVRVYLATKAFEKSKKAYLAANERNIAIAATQQYFISNLDKMVDFARNGNKNYQMAVFSDLPKHCTRASNANALDEFQSYAQYPALEDTVVTVNLIVVF